MVSSSRTKLRDPAVCRIFFSSPFNGMEGEREELTKKYWPQIESLCKKHGIRFVPVDMRWGITTESSDNAQTINICLREIDRSDLFVGFFGQRYGWAGANDEELQRNFEAAVHAYPWIDSYRDRSVTELEFLHGHLRHPGEIPAVICFRSKEYDDVEREKGAKDGNKRQIYKFSSESDLATELMNDLKARVKGTEDKCLKLDMAYDTPKEGAKIMFEALWRHLTEVLLKEANDVKENVYTTQMAQHTAFLNTQVALYHGGDTYMQILNSHVSDAGSKPVVVVGDSGSGKTAFLCNWLHRHLKQSIYDVTVYHFVGGALESTSIKNILQRVNVELLKYLGKEPDTEKRTEQEMQGLWVHNMKELSGKSRRVFIVIDGVDKIVYESKISKPMYWLPSDIPHGVHVILSCCNTQTDVIEELTNQREYRKIEIEPLSHDVQRAIAKASLQVRGKELSGSQLDRVMEAEHTNNPLFLKVVLEELCMFGKFRELDKKIDSLVHCDSIVELFTQYLSRLENDYSTDEYPQHMVQEVMSALCVSRKGLMESEITAMLDIPPPSWSPFYYALEPFVIKEGQFIRFGFTQLNEAVRQTYLSTKEKKKEAYWKQFRFFQEEGKMFLERGYNAGDVNHAITEAAWLAYTGGYHKNCIGFVSQVPVFRYFKLKDAKEDLLMYYTSHDTTGDFVLKQCLPSIDLLIVDEYNRQVEQYCQPNTAAFALEMLKNLCWLLKFGHYLDQHMQILLRIKHILDANTEVGTEEEKLENLYDIASLYMEYRDGEKTLKYATMVQDILNARGVDSLSSQQIERLSFAYHTSGTAYEILANYDQAERDYNEEIKLLCMIDAGGDNHIPLNVAIAREALAMVYRIQGRIDEAVHIYEQTLKDQEQFYFGVLPPAVAHTLTAVSICYRRQERWDLAVSSLKRALRITQTNFGEFHQDVAIVYFNLANLESDRKDFTQALQHLDKTIQIFEAIGQSNLPTCLMAVENAVLANISRQTMEGAEPYYNKLIDLMKATDQFDLGVPTVHDHMVRHLIMTQQTEKARDVLPHLCRSPKLRNEYLFTVLYLLDWEAKDGVERAADVSMDRGLELYPHAKFLVTRKITDILVKSRDINTITALMEKYFEAVGEEDEDFILMLADNFQGDGQWPEGQQLLFEYWRPKLKEPKGVTTNLAVCYCNTGRYDDALDMFTEALKLDPSRLPVWSTVLDLAIGLNKVEVAMDTMKRAREKWGEDSKEFSELVTKHQEKLDNLSSES